MAAQPIDHIDGEGRGIYFVGNPSGGEPRYLAEMTYEWRDGVMAILHTGVREALQGQGVAGQLLARAVADARAAGVKILPLCSYVRGKFDKDPDTYADVDARA